jgi:hypothetical protein
MASEDAAADSTVNRATGLGEGPWHGELLMPV